MKYDFQHIFDLDEFEGRVYMVQKFANDTFKQKKGGTPMTETRFHKKGTVNSKFIEAHNLTSCSNPDDFISLFPPLNGNT